MDTRRSQTCDSEILADNTCNSLCEWQFLESDMSVA